MNVTGPRWWYKSAFVQVMAWYCITNTPNFADIIGHQVKFHKGLPIRFSGAQDSSSRHQRIPLLLSPRDIITRDSEVIMFSPCVCVFVCLFVRVYVCHDVCPDDLTMKDWCHTNNISQLHCWGSLVVQVMFHTLMTSLMTSQGHKVGQILKFIYLRQYLS